MIQPVHQQGVGRTFHIQTLLVATAAASAVHLLTTVADMRLSLVAESESHWLREAGEAVTE